MHGQQSRPLRATEPHNNRRRIDQQTAAKSHQSGRSPHELPHSRSAQANERKNEGWRAIAQTNKRANEHARASKRTTVNEPTQCNAHRTIIQDPNTDHQPADNQSTNQTTNQTTKQIIDSRCAVCFSLYPSLRLLRRKSSISAQCKVVRKSARTSQQFRVGSWKLEVGRKPLTKFGRSFVRSSSSIVVVVDFVRLQALCSLTHSL